MARRCEICGKEPRTGFAVSHSNRRTKRRWLPNLQSIRVSRGGSLKRVKVCTQCLKSNPMLRAG